MMDMNRESKRKSFNLDFIGDLEQLVKSISKHELCKFGTAEIGAIQRKLKDEEWKDRIGRCPCPDALSATCLGEWRNDGLDIVPLQVANDGIGIQALQRIRKIKIKRRSL